MPALTKDVVLTQQHIRGFIQYGGAAPTNEAQYYGARNQYFFVSGVENPVKGSISPINAPDPYRRKRYERIGRSVDAPDFGTYTLSVAEKHGTVPRVMTDVGCPITVYLTAGRCKNPSDLNRGYESWVYVLSSGEVTDRSVGDMFAMDSDDALMTELTLSTYSQYPVGPLFLGEQAATTVNANVVDVVYAPPNDCAGCQIGNERIYAISNPIGGSPATQAEVIYSVDGGAWTEVNITGLGATVAPNAIEIVGEYLVVLSRAAGAHYYARIDPDTGIPGTWATVTSGYNASGGPNDLYVVSPSEIYIVGQGGYIYRATDITAGVTVVSAAGTTSQHLQRIHGTGETLVAVGNFGNVLFSADGMIWATTTQYPTSQTLLALSVKSEKIWWVGAGNGNLWYTVTSGKTWVQVPIPSATQVNDIVFATEEVGYVAYDTAGPQGNLLCTIDGGNTWAAATPASVPARIGSSIPVFDRVNRIGVPGVATESGIAANFLTIAGLAADGSDGVIYVANANLL